MAEVTAEQRQREIEARERFKEEVAEHPKREREELERQLSVADRLMRRTHLARFKTVFQDDLGDFAIETRQMTSGERFRAVKLNNQLAQSEKAPEKYAEAVEGFKQLAKEITLTPDMDAYYDGDQVSDDIVIAVVSRTFQGTMRLVGEAITSFRAE